MSGRTFAFAGSLNRAMPDFPPAHGDGIAVYAFDEAEGRLEHRSTFTGIDNPSFLALDAKRRRLYACTEWAGRNEGLVVALDIDAETGALSYINMQPTLGSVTCHLAFDRTGDFLVASNYTVAPEGSRPGAAVAVFPIREDGGLGPAVASVAHEGEGAVLPTSLRSHAHCAIFSPEGGRLFVADLGLDRTMAYRWPLEDGKLVPADPPFAAVPEGSGPRHLAWGPDGRQLYAICELGSSFAVFDFDAASGALQLVQQVSTLPAGFSGQNYCAELAFSPDGRFLYGTNRGHDSIVRFAVAPDGRLSLPDWISSGGHWPRNLTFDSSGRFVLVSNQHGDNIVVFHQDPVTGGLVDAGRTFVTGTPMRVVLARF